MTTLSRVECGQCGASTPLPEDLTQPTFRCAYCHRDLVTALYAGKAAVSADHLLAHLDRVVETGMTAREAVDAAPRFSDRNLDVRHSACVQCGAPVVVPMDLHQNVLTCGACGRVQNVDRHVSQKERLENDMRRQMEGNAALKRLIAEGAPCTNCGGMNHFPDDGTVQIVCTFCNTTLLLGQYVDASAVARRRLKEGVFAMRDELLRRQEEQQAKVRYFTVAVIVVVAVIALVANLGGSR